MSQDYDQWARHYDLAEGDRSVFVNFYRRLVTPGTHSLIDLGCGTGVITVALAERMAHQAGDRRALRITGVDESAAMLAIARARDNRIEWIQGNLCAPPVAGEYDLAICCFNVVQLLLREEEVEAAFRSARRLLAPHGLFAFDIYQPNLAYLSIPQTNRLVRMVTDERGCSLELREDFVYDPAARLMTLYWRIIDPARPTAAPLATMEYRLRQYFPAEIDHLLAAAGLVVEQRYGDFDLSEFDANSKKQILLCRRAS